jgi:2-amino-4-hydroxy-6-hydroxymethyldihydropteridine diphosphokinase
MKRTAIGLGTNLGDREALLIHAIKLLRAIPDCENWRFSPVYQTAAVDCPEPLAFLNAAAVCMTRLAPELLLEELQRIEDGLGRERPYPHAPRPIDLDLLLYGDLHLESARLTVPHPRMHLRMFVLEPLADIQPRAVHPVMGRTVAELLADLRHGQSREPQPYPLTL